MRDYLEERRAEVYSVNLEFGSAIHDALEKYKDPERHKGENEKKPKLTIEQICTNFEESFRKKYGRVKDKDPRALSDKEIDLLVMSGKRILKHIDEVAELDQTKVLFVEHKLMEKIDRTDDVKIKFKGFIDIVLKTKDKRGNSIVILCDYKTCSWGWNREKRSNEALQAQLRLYKHFFSKKFKLDPKNVKTAFVLLKKTPRGKDHPVEWLPFSSGDKTTMRAVLKLNEAITGMQSNDYKKNRNACKNPYGDICPYFGTDLCSDD